MAVMWRYRLQVTFQTAAQKLAELRCGDSPEQGGQAKHEILYYFMQKESALRDVDVLPRIIKFHKLLLQKYDHKITRKRARETKIKSFFQLKAKEGNTEMKQLYEDYQRVWDISERRQTGKGPDDSGCQRLDSDTPLTTFLTTSKILDTLVGMHNDLIACLEKNGCNLGPEVNLLDVKPTHLVTYDPDKDLLPLVTANCSSSLELGQGTNVKYDFDKMEQQLIERLCEGKSRIVKTDIPMVFSDSLTAMCKLQKLEGKIKQESFTTEIESELYKDTPFADDVYELVANLNTAIGFLHTVGGDPDRSLEAFMREDLRMDPVPLPSRTRKHCKLKHIRALWLFMSNEREKHAAKVDAVPFATLTEEQHNRFRDPLHDEQMEALMVCLTHADVEKLLMELFTCIMLYIINMDDTCSVEIPLIDCLDAAEDMTMDPAILKLPVNLKPIQVSQCMSAWRAICDYSQDIE